MEYATEEEADQAAKTHRNIDLSGHKLYVIKSMTDRVTNFGEFHLIDFATNAIFMICQ